MERENTDCCRGEPKAVRQFNWTCSKVLAFLILGLGFIYAMTYPEAYQVLTAAMTASGGVMAVKTGSEAYKEKK